MKKGDIRSSGQSYMEYLESEGFTAFLFATKRIGKEFEAFLTVSAPDDDWDDILITAMVECMHKNKDFKALIYRLQEDYEESKQIHNNPV